eukprot:scaffold242903_cov21-Prasinocladus_malaysianus.AAC.2
MSYLSIILWTRQAAMSHTLIGSLLADATFETAVMFTDAVLAEQWQGMAATQSWMFQVDNRAPPSSSAETIT